MEPKMTNKEALVWYKKSREKSGMTDQFLLDNLEKLDLETIIFNQGKNFSRETMKSIINDIYNKKRYYLTFQYFLGEILGYLKVDYLRANIVINTNLLAEDVEELIVYDSAGRVTDDGYDGRFNTFLLRILYDNYVMSREFIIKNIEEIYDVYKTYTYLGIEKNRFRLKGYDLRKNENSDIKLLLEINDFRQK